MMSAVRRLAEQEHSAAFAQLGSRITAITKFGADADNDPFVKVKDLICEGDGDVVGVVAPLRGGAQVVLHGIQVVEVGVRLRVRQDGEAEEDGEGQVEVEREEGEVREKRTWMACGWDEDSRTS